MAARELKLAPQMPRWLATAVRTGVGVSAETSRAKGPHTSLRLWILSLCSENSLETDSRCSPSLPGSVRMPAFKLAHKTWSTFTRVGLPNGFAVASLHLGNTFSRSAAHGVQVVVTLAAWVGPDTQSKNQRLMQCPRRLHAWHIPPSRPSGHPSSAILSASKVQRRRLDAARSRSSSSMSTTEPPSTPGARHLCLDRPPNAARLQRAPACRPAS